MRPIFLPEPQILSKIYKKISHYFSKIIKLSSKFWYQIDEIGPIFTPILENFKDMTNVYTRTVLHWIRGHRYTRRLILRPISAARPRIDFYTKNSPLHKRQWFCLDCSSLNLMQTHIRIQILQTDHVGFLQCSNTVPAASKSSCEDTQTGATVQCSSCRVPSVYPYSYGYSYSYSYLTTTVQCSSCRVPSAYPYSYGYSYSYSYLTTTVQCSSCRVPSVYPYSYSQFAVAKQYCVIYELYVASQRKLNVNFLMMHILYLKIHETFGRSSPNILLTKG